jgi:hypothetical protein
MISTIKFIPRLLFLLPLAFFSCGSNAGCDLPKALQVDGRPIHPIVILYTFFGDSSRLEPKSIYYQENNERIDKLKSALEVKHSSVDYSSIWKYKHDPISRSFNDRVTYQAWELSNGDCLVWLDHYSTQGTGHFSHLGVVSREGGHIRNVAELAFGDRCHGGISVDFLEDNILQYRTSATPEDIFVAVKNQLGLSEIPTPSLPCSPLHLGGRLIWQERFEEGRPVETRLAGIDFEASSQFFNAEILQSRTYATSKGIFEAVKIQLDLPETSTPALSCSSVDSGGSLIWQERFEEGRLAEIRLAGIDFGVGFTDLFFFLNNF